MKPKTHIHLAEIALKDALEDGYVSMYATDYANGTVSRDSNGGLLGYGLFEVDPHIREALRSNSAQFRAGVLGPDAYPDKVAGAQTTTPPESP